MEMRVVEKKCGSSEIQSGVGAECESESSHGGQDRRNQRKNCIVHFRDLVSFICCTIGRIERMDPLR